MQKRRTRKRRSRKRTVKLASHFAYPHPWTDGNNTDYHSSYPIIFLFTTKGN